MEWLSDLVLVGATTALVMYLWWAFSNKPEPDEDEDEELFHD